VILSLKREAQHHYDYYNMVFRICQIRDWLEMLDCVIMTQQISVRFSMVILRRSEREDKINRYIRNRVKEARIQREASQVDIAQVLEKTGSAVSDIERGRVQVSASDLSLIAAYLEKPISYFYPPPNRGAEQSDLSSEEQELVHFYRQIGSNAAMQKLAVQQIENLADAAIQADLETLARQAEAERMSREDN